MGEPAYKKKHYTCSDYQQLPDDERWEIIGGEIFDMSPAPTTRHQSIAGELFRQMANHLHGKPCKPFIAPTDLKLSDEDVVQPDLMVVCDEKQITESHVDGATYRFMGMYQLADDFKSPSFSELELEMKDVFDFPLDPEDPVYVVKKDTSGGEYST